MSAPLQHISYRRLFFYLITIAAVILLYSRFSELKLIQKFFIDSNWRYLVLVVVIQLLFFVVQAANYQAVLKIKGLRVGMGELFPMGYVVQFISQAIPTAGVSGQIFFIYYLKKYGLTIAEGIGRAMLELATLYVAYAVFFVTSFVLILRSGILAQDHRFVYFIYAFVLFFMMVAGVVIFAQKRRRVSRFHWIVNKIASFFKRTDEHTDYIAVIKDELHMTLGWHTLRNHLGLFTLACFWQGILLFSHVLTLYIIALSLGHPIPFVACFVAFTFSKFLSMVSVVPGAPGVFEGAMMLILITFGVDKSVALAATLLTRAFTFWLPMPIGWVLYGRYMRRFERIENDKIVVT